MLRRSLADLARLGYLTVARRGGPAPTAGARLGHGAAAVIEVPPPPPPLMRVGSGEAPSSEDRNRQSHLTPKFVVELLDKHIVGQTPAKKAVAVALRNRWRRMRLEGAIKEDIVPKNILMVGPTGCGKTEIARRLAKLTDAPFIKVEATKFTEVGFHGRDVDQIIRDLLDIAIAQTRTRVRTRLQQRITDSVENTLLDSLLSANVDNPMERETYRGHLRAGLLDTQKVKVEVTDRTISKMQTATTASMGDVTEMFRMLRNNSKPENKEMLVKDARVVLAEVEMDKHVSPEAVIKEAILSVENDGIVFFDEIDKIVSPRESRSRGADASAEGVQRDLLPIIEGSAISTKHGNVNTDHILFIASGAFHSCKPSDMMAELQGRLPIRVALAGLGEDDMYRILTEPENNLIRQQAALLLTENIDLSFNDDAIRQIAHVSYECNKMVENIGARRLHTVLERIVEEVSYAAPELAAEHAQTGGGGRLKITIDREAVDKALGDMILAQDMRKFIL